MESGKSKLVLLWAVDPFSSDAKSAKGAAHAIQNLAAGHDLEILPVYLATIPLSDLPQGFSVDIFEGVREKGQDTLNAILKGLPLKAVAPLKILQIPVHSIHEQITQLLAYAEESRADLIVTGTRGRKGLPRWFLGSFAESLSLRSERPLLVVNSSWKAESKHPFKEILFPTDFSNSSHEVFGEVIRLAQATRGKICIFHKYLHVSTPVWNSPLEAKLSYRSIYADGLKAAKQAIEKWKNEALETGVQASGVIDARPGVSASEAILNRSRRQPCLLAMAGESGDLKHRLLGGTTRKVIRMATSPVWVLHATKAKVERASWDDAPLRRYEDKSAADAPVVMRQYLSLSRTGR